MIAWSVTHEFRVSEKLTHDMSHEMGTTGRGRVNGSGGPLV